MDLQQFDIFNVRQNQKNQKNQKNQQQIIDDIDKLFSLYHQEKLLSGQQDYAFSAQDLQQLQQHLLTKHYLLQQNSIILVAYQKDKNEIAGCAIALSVSESDKICELKHLYILPKFRGLSLGRNLAYKLIQNIKNNGFQRVLINNLPNAKLAAKLYSELGFVNSDSENFKATIQPSINNKLLLSLDLNTWSETQTDNENLFQLFDYNRSWAKQTTAMDPNYFVKLSKLQTPEYLWIGCSDSRVPANQVVGLLPGELFVHRNVANVIAHSDLNSLAVIQYAVDVLKVKHIIVVGHFGCGGVSATLHKKRVGIVDLWLRHVQDVYDKHQAAIESVTEESSKQDLLCSLNVLEQVVNVARTTVVDDAWNRGQQLTIHGWIYDIRDGLMHDLGITIDNIKELNDKYQIALEAVLNK